MWIAKFEGCLTEIMKSGKFNIIFDISIIRGYWPMLSIMLT